MAGLNLGVGGGLRLGGAAPAALPATVGQTAYGASSSTDTSGSGKVEPWHLGVAVPVLALGWLIFLRWSLPK